MKPRVRTESPLASMMADNARTGQGLGVLGLLAAFCGAVDAGRTPDPPILQFVSRAFHRVLLGEKVDVAFGIVRDRSGRPKKPKPERPDDPKAKRDLDLAMEVAKCREKRLRLMDAYRRVAKEKGVSPAIVRRAYRDWGSHATLERQIQPIIQRGIGQLLAGELPEGEQGIAAQKARGQLLMSGAKFMQEMGDAFQSWDAWEKGLVTEELHQRARDAALAFCKISGAAEALNGTDSKPTSAWTNARGLALFARLMTIWTTPPRGYEICLARESELKVFWMNGFRDIQSMLGKDQGRRGS